MKTKSFLILCIIIMRLSVVAQVKIGDNATNINVNSLLELETTNKGFVLPRISITNVSSSSPLAAGLLTGTVVYNTNSTTTGGSGAGIYYWDGSQWNFLANTTIIGNYWSFTGNSGTSPSSNFIGTTDAKDFVARTNNAERLRITSAGNVGIGLTNPSYALSVLSASNPLYLSGVQATASFTTDSLLTIKSGVVKKAPYSSLTSNFWNLTGNSGTSVSTNFIGTSDAVDFVTRTSNTERLRITSTGNVGIGLTNPSYKLAVLSASNPLYLSGVQATSTFGADSVLTINSGVVKKSPYSSLLNLGWSLTGNSGTNYSNNFIGTSDNISMRFRTNNVQRMIIDSIGKVGIGLSNPSYALSVLSASDPLYLSGVQATSTLSADSVLTINSGIVKKTPYSSLTGAFWNLTGNSGTNASTNFIGTSDAIDFVARTNNAERLRITSGGNVGIGIANPSYKLAVLSASNPLYLSGVQATSTFSADSVLTINAGIVKKTPYSSLTGSFWNLTGNSGTDYSTNFLGTTDNVSLRFRTNNFQRIIIDSVGKVGIGLSNPDYALSVLSATNPLYLSGVQATSTFSSDSILTINAGIVKKAPYSSLTGSFWSLTGNSGTDYGTNFLGTTDNVSLRFRTNNTEQMILDSLGTLNVGSYGAATFNIENPPKLSVDYGTTTSNTIAYLRGSIDNYFQINLRNKSNGLNASTDYVATADNGTDTTYYVDFGINSSGYGSGADYFGGPDDAYLYAYSRNLLIGTQKASTDIIFLLNGGSVKNNTAMRIVGPGGNIVIGKGEGTNNPVGNIIRGPNAVTGSNNTAGGNLTLQGGSASGTAAGGSLNLYGGTAVSGTAGAVSINASTNNATNINTGTSTGNITIGNSSNNILFPKFNTTGGMIYTTAATGQIASTGSNMKWDDVNNRLGIGLINPSYKLSVLAASDPLYLSGVQTGTNSDSLVVIRNGVIMKIQSFLFYLAKGQYDVTIPSYIGNNTGLTVQVTVPSAPYSAAGPNPIVIVNPEKDLPDGLIIAWARVSATNTVSINFRNVTNQSVPPQTIKFDISVQQ